MPVGYNTTASEGSLNVPLTPLHIGNHFDDVFPPDITQGREQDACLPNQVQDLSMHQRSMVNSHQSGTPKPPLLAGCPNNGTDRLVRGSDCDRSASRDLQQFAARQYRRGIQVPNTLDINHTSRDGVYPCPTYYSPQYSSNIAASPMSDCGGMVTNSFNSERPNDMNSRNRSWSADYYAHHGRISLPSPGNGQQLVNNHQRLQRQKDSIEYEPDNSTLTTSEPPPLSHLPVPLPGYRTNPHDGNRHRNNIPSSDRFRFYQGNQHSPISGNEYTNPVGYPPNGHAGMSTEFRMPHPWAGKK